MSVNPKDVLRLLEQLAENTNESLDYTGLGIMSMKVEEKMDAEMPHRYLYENLYKASKSRIDEGKTTFRPNLPRLDIIAKFLGFKNFNDFILNDQQTLVPQLKACLGIWYAYVRSSSELDEVLRSPVTIAIENGKCILTEYGPFRTFKGEVFHQGGFISIHAKSPDKSYFFCYKVGLATQPKVLQGTFAGFSSGGSPVAGRKILVREEVLQFKEMTNQKVTFKELEIQPELLDSRIATYFRDYCNNYAKVKYVGGFGLDDLLNG